MLKPGVRFDLTRHLYLTAIYACQAQRKVIYKASQMGASEYAVSYALHACDQRSATVLYVFPTDSHVSDFSSARIGPALEASDYLDSIVVEGAAAGGKRGADRVTLKRVRDRFLYLRGARVTPAGQAAQLKSVDADVIVLDEWDEMDARAPDIARKRLGHSTIAEELDISTPTYTGRGIHAEYKKTDQREWFIQCEHCGEWQPLSIENVVIEEDELERPVAWFGMDEDRAYAACRRCGEELNRLAQGQWVARKPGVDVAGFHLSKLFSPVADLLEIVKSLQTTDETKRRETINQDLGLPYTPRGGQITDVVLDKCQREYALGPMAGERPVMGVDVGRVLHVVVRGPLSTVEGGKPSRPLRYAGDVDTFRQVANLIRQYEVQRCVIDALPETRKARDLQAAFPDGVVWLAYYTGGTGSKYQEAVRWNKREGIVDLDRTRLLDTTFARFVDQENTLPADIGNVRDYYDHLKAPVRQLDNSGKSGNVVARYVEDGPDHFAHAENYATAAGEGQSWWMW